MNGSMQVRDQIIARIDKEFAQGAMTKQQA
jgi:hypothetical protein